MFAVLGTPKILHSDNGLEFVNEIIHSIVKEWPGEVTTDQETLNAMVSLSKAMAC